MGTWNNQHQRYLMGNQKNTTNEGEFLGLWNGKQAS
jgi:hypothetical protein